MQLNKDGGFVLIGLLVIAVVLALLSLQVLQESMLDQRMVGELSEKVVVQADARQALLAGMDALKQSPPLHSACGLVVCDNHTLLADTSIVWHPVVLKDDSVFQASYIIQPFGGDIYQVTARAGRAESPNEYVIQRVADSIKCTVR